MSTQQSALLLTCVVACELLTFLLVVLLRPADFFFFFFFCACGCLVGWLVGWLACCLCGYVCVCVCVCVFSFFLRYLLSVVPSVLMCVCLRLSLQPWQWHMQFDFIDQGRRHRLITAQYGLAARSLKRRRCQPPAKLNVHRKQKSDIRRANPCRVLDADINSSSWGKR